MEMDIMDMQIDSTYTNYSNNWLLDYEFMDEMSTVSVNATTFPLPLSPPLPLPPPPTPPASVTIDFSCPTQSLNCCSYLSEVIDCSFEDPERFKEIGSRKRSRTEEYNISRSRACREKTRRDKLNERFLELSSALEPGRPPKVDKIALLSDATRKIAQLRSEVHKLNESNEDLQLKIKDLKAEKNEHRDEKNKLKAEKEKIEQQVKCLTAHPSFASPASLLASAFAAKSQSTGNKLMPVIGYPGVAMWQFMQPTVVDTSLDHILHPPVA
ncbi:hypothetical protein Leryth_007749 [Lithospermum erythrorhizon]|nr:hypothetical protein Leryth_007749 [Lithospermum erythrorhizon]